MTLRDRLVAALPGRTHFELHGPVRLVRPG